MSLLLDALKKSGHGQHANQDVEAQAGAGGLTLEDMPPEKQRVQHHQSPAQPAATVSSSTPARDAGKNLFAAKKAAPGRGRKMRLGIVPVTFIACSVIGGVYGLYFWWEMTPHTPSRPLQHPVPAPTAPPAPIALNTPAPAQPLPSAQPAPAAQPAPEQAQPAEPARVHVARQARRAAPRRQRAPASSQPFSIEAQQQVDAITPLLDSGYSAYRDGNFALAQQNYNAVLKQDGNNRDALLGLAAIAQQQGNDAAATGYYGQVLALDPRDPQAQAGMSALEKGGNAAERESRLKLVLEQHPQSAALNFALGNLYARQSRWAEAQQSYFAAYSLQPSAPQYAYNLAISLDHLGQNKLAAQYYQRTLDLDGAAGSGIDHQQIQQRLQQLQQP